MFLLKTRIKILEDLIFIFYYTHTIFLLLHLLGIYEFKMLHIYAFVGTHQKINKEDKYYYYVL